MRWAGWFGAVLVAAAVLLALRAPADPPPGSGAGPAPRPARERGVPACGAACRVGALAARLSADPATGRGGRRPSRVLQHEAVLRIRRRQDGLCQSTNRRDTCQRAVAGAEIRRLWRSLRRSSYLRRKAEVLLGVGDRAAMTTTEVVDAIRADLDARLTQAVDAGALGEAAHRRALACYDAPAGCGRVALGRR